MNENDPGISVLNCGMIWFGAAVSIAEILTGTLIAPLGFAKGAAAVIIGHIIGCVPLYMAGVIGACSRKSAMETVKISFGQKGSAFFSLLNVVQLIGWTAVMIIGGGRAASVVAQNYAWSQSVVLWCIVIGVMIIIWVLIGIKNLETINTVTMAILFLLTLMLSLTVFKGASASIAPLSDSSLSFGSAVELSAAMPLSWLPLISDYTKNAKEPKKSAFVSVVVYFMTSSWMYMIGLGASIFTGESDIAKIMVGAGLGLAAVIIVIISTVTTTFLDVYSAGISLMSISQRLNQKMTAIAVCLTGMFLAVFTPVEQYENFLFFIGSVFAPMISILIADFFIKKRNHFEESINVFNFILWFTGFVIYRLFMSIDTVIGNTLPVMVIVCILAVLPDFARSRLAVNFSINKKENRNV
jgi:putative hydroxymethylpyrimidine transporter CytX